MFSPKEKKMISRLLSFISIIGILSIASLFSIYAESPAASYGFDVSIFPDQEIANFYQAKLVIKELASDKVIAEPTIRLRSAEQGTTSTTGETDNGINFQFSVGVNEKDGTAEYDASVLHAKTVVSRSKGKISFKKQLEVK